MDTKEQLDAAMEACASEPVHIPGLIQPVGALIAYETRSGRIAYASENAASLFGLSTGALFARPIQDVVSRPIIHRLRNVEGLGTFSTKRRPIGEMEIGDAAHQISAFGSGDVTVLEIEEAPLDPILEAEVMHNVSDLIDTFDQVNEEGAFLELAVQVLRQISGYDRVMAYRFDHAFNGEVVAERRRAKQDPYLGQRFPHWDIPAQAREIMKTTPLRFIAGVDQTPVGIQAADDSLPPLDLTLSQLRGVSPIHLEYLRNMGTAATMTMSLVVDGRLWGMISFHHMRPRAPDPYVRQICEAFQPYLQTRLSLLIKEAQVALIESIDRLRIEVQEHLDQALSLEDRFPHFAPRILEPFQGQGLSIMAQDVMLNHGLVPKPEVQDAIIALARQRPRSDGPIVLFERLKEDLPGALGQDLMVAGAIVALLPKGEALVIYREPKLRQVKWAGDPTKRITVENGQTRLQPRGSFSVYLEDQGHSAEPWIGRDVALARTLGHAISASSERHQTVRANLRQQALMIDELNHRVRNILALIRSVSQQTLRHSKDMASYSEALERRIHALAMAHDVGAGKAVEAISMRKIITLEAQPFLAGNPESFRITGTDRMLDTRYGPIFALLIHELVTNASKYGALSRETGRVVIDLRATADGLRLDWREVGGPPVTPQERQGFGATLIEKAVPYELGGHSELTFAPDGLQAVILLPHKIFDAADPSPPMEAAPTGDLVPGQVATIPLQSVLVVEDNYMIAVDLEEVLTEAGVVEVETVSNADDALEMIARSAFDVAILDVHLGRKDMTSFEVARSLKRAGIPYFFVTGYGDGLAIPDDIAGVPVLTKPLLYPELHGTLFEMRILGREARA